MSIATLGQLQENYSYEKVIHGGNKAESAHKQLNSL